MAAQAETAVWERRLRPLYDLLDSGNNKKVVTEADKLLKRHGHFNGAQVLKAIALVRQGKIQEARQILHPVAQGAPTDDGTIQALTICYRELNDLATLTSVLEAACKKEPSEELLTHCFMAQVRIEDYQKQHLTALNLYKMFNKPTYFGWAVGSLLVKYERDSLSSPPPPQQQPKVKNGLATLPLQLAERMCVKFIAESESPVEESILSLYFCTLEKLEKWKNLLEAMKDHGYGDPQPKWSSSSHFHQLYCSALTKLGKMEELFQYLKSTFMANPDEYALLKEIISLASAGQKAAVLELLDEFRENHPSRVIALGDLLFCRQHFQERGDAGAKRRIEEDLKMAIKYGADKLSFNSELTDLFRKVISKPAAQAMLKLMTPGYSETEDNYDKVSKVIKDVNFELLSQEVVPVTSSLDRMTRADRCFGKYLVCEKAKPDLTGETNLRTKESEFHDQFLLLAATSLLTEYYNASRDNKDPAGLLLDLATNKKDWLKSSNGELPKELKQMRSELVESSPANLAKYLEGMNVSPDDNVLNREDIILLLITAILLLEYGLDRTPHNPFFRILLAKLYSSLGANLSALKVVRQLNLNHIQWDTLGYLLLFETVSGGLYAEALKMLLAAENMYLGYKRESMEYVIKAYKYGSFTKIPEFLGFRDQLLSSTQYGLVFCEKRLLEYVLFTNAPGDLRKVADILSNELQPDLLDAKTKFCDNRDFTVLQDLAEDVDLDYLKHISGETDIHFYKLRMSLLFCLTKLVCHISNLDDDHDAKAKEAEEEEIIKYIDAFDKHVRMWDGIYVSYGELEIPTSLFHEIWPPRCQKYKEIGCLAVLKEVFNYVKVRLLNSHERDKPNLDLEDLKGILASGSSSLLFHLTNYEKTEQVRPLAELSIDAGFTKLHYILETFSFMRILLECVIDLDKRRVGNYACKMNTNKKRRAAILANRKKLHQELIRIPLDSMGTLLSYIDEFRNKMNQYKYNRFVGNQDKAELLLRPGFLFKPFGDGEYYYSAFFENLQESLRAQTDQIRKVGQNLVDCLKHLLES